MACDSGIKPSGSSVISFSKRSAVRAASAAGENVSWQSGRAHGLFGLQGPQAIEG